MTAMLVTQDILGLNLLSNCDLFFIFTHSQIACFWMLSAHFLHFEVVEL